MAIWKISFDALQFLGRDKNDWPIINKLSDFHEIEDSYLSKAPLRAKKILKEELPDTFISIVVTNIQRIDKTTDKSHFFSMKYRHLLKNWPIL
ncbi:hypothetical protein [Leptospira santarosai]|uniref:Uncharacterized protein n=1 Tax=Leptospira santarosai str. MOR084 TaxID=1049984 RepID=A0A0E2BFS1_9LEPT|nr:hypothetical protein [Leptospira santarosai]EKO34193.1 hypothetical protein LEP1GSC179_0696 [Leptospira santarosai str. MOR084]